MNEGDSPGRKLAIRLRVVARQLEQAFDQSADRSGLSRAKWGLIGVVSRHPGATQRCLAEYLQVTEVTAGRTIDRLCADGYLERREDPNDRRAHRIYVTPASQPVLTQLSDLASALEERAFAGLTERDVVGLDALLEMISQNIVELREKPVAWSPSLVAAESSDCN